MKKLPYSNAFTIVELIISISIIGTLLIFSMIGFSNVLRNSRDLKRKNDLKKIQYAMEEYYSDHRTYQVTGGGWNGSGIGWVGFENGTSYPSAVTRILKNQGYLKEFLIDDPTRRPGYMIYLCNSNQIYSLSATLENPTTEDINYARDHTCNGSGANGTVTRYGKNYAVTNRAL